MDRSVTYLWTKCMRIATTTFAIQLVVVAGGCQSFAGPTKIEVQGFKNVTQDGDLYVAGLPTQDGLRAMRSRGVKTIIDLRTTEEGTTEEAQMAPRMGFKYVHVPMQGDRLTVEQSRELAKIANQHLGETTLLHCAGGNRAAAAYGIFLGATSQCSTDQIISRAETAGLQNPKMKEQLRQRIDEGRKDEWGQAKAKKRA
ncbi:MAG TPA: sulfur transferase domain-containing protein [Phycisphaerae bacterium]|nr:sulfur transferase domain-containing protein [Phycisphaerae bacterium]